MELAVGWYVVQIKVDEIRRLIGSEMKLVQCDIMNPEGERSRIKNVCYCTHVFIAVQYLRVVRLLMR